MGKYLVIALILAVGACGTIQEKRKLNEKEFENLLFDLHVADALLAEKNLNDRRFKDLNKSYYNFVFLKYKITRAEFEDEVHFYSRNAKEYYKIYDRVLTRLNDEKNTFMKSDSIQRETKKKETKPRLPKSDIKKPIRAKPDTTKHK